MERKTRAPRDASQTARQRQARHTASDRARRRTLQDGQPDWHRETDKTDGRARITGSTFTSSPYRKTHRGGEQGHLGFPCLIQHKQRHKNRKKSLPLPLLHTASAANGDAQLSAAFFGATQHTICSRLARTISFRQRFIIQITVFHSTDTCLN